MKLIAQLQGEREASRAMRGLADRDIVRATRRAVRRAARMVLLDARRRTPRESGDLARSLRLRTMRSKWDKSAAMVAVSLEKKYFKGDRWYGVHQELGTRYNEQARFMLDAAYANKSRAREVFYSHWARELHKERAKQLS